MIDEIKIIKPNESKRVKLILKIVIFVIILSLFYPISFLENKPNKLIDYQKLIRNLNESLLFKISITYNDIFIFLLIIGFNIWNIYKSYLFCIGFSISCYFSSIIRMIKRVPPLFIKNFEEREIINNINLLCNNNLIYSSPSSDSLISTFIILTFTSYMNKEKFLKNNLIYRMITFLISFIIIFIYLWYLLFQLNSSFYDILIGFMIGLLLFFIFCYFLPLDFNESKQFIQIIKINTMYFIFVNLSLFSILDYFYFYDSLSQDFNPIENYCLKSSFKYKKYPIENIGLGLNYLINLIITISLKLQYLYICKKSYNLFIKGYFFIEDDTYRESLTSILSNNNITYYSQLKNILFYILRVLICFLLIYISKIPNKFIIFEKINFNKLIITDFIPNIFFHFCLFFITKPLFNYLNINNI